MFTAILGGVCFNGAGCDAPAQQYRFLDVGAEELRGTFLSPARSEQRLLYTESPWRLSIYDRGYPAHFLVASVRRPFSHPSHIRLAQIKCRVGLLPCPLSTHVSK